MERFKTLMLREWMQHRNGWLIVMGVPLLLVLVAAAFGQAQVEFDEGDAQGPYAPLLVALGTMGGLGVLTLMLAWGSALIQSPGLARRDQQDRSIEFWLSLPVSPAQSLGAMLLMHLLLLPWLALAVGLAGGLLVSLLAVARAFGIGEWFALPWTLIAPAALACALRLALGVLLATLWLSPLILGTMAASAWLKRWGVPAVAATLGLGGLVLDKGYGNPVVWEVLGTLGRNAGQSLVFADRAAPVHVQSPEQLVDVLPMVTRLMTHDAGVALGLLAQPAFVAALAAAAAAFGLLWWRRMRGA